MSEQYGPIQYHPIDVPHRSAGMVAYVGTAWIKGAAPEPRVIHAVKTGTFASYRVDSQPGDGFELVDTITSDDSPYGGAPVVTYYWREKVSQSP